MAGLQETAHSATVTWLGLVPRDGGSLRSEPRDALELIFGGVAGEQHEGARRPSCSRVTMLHPKGTEITNTRQLSVLCADELDGIAETMGLASLDPALLGATIVLRGIPDFSHVPPGSRLQAPSGATVTVDVENGPCLWPAKEIETEAPGFGKVFKPAATDRRGITAWVERPGRLAIGDAMALFVPHQRAWAP